jgi:hypothetical protein
MQTTATLAKKTDEKENFLQAVAHLVAENFGVMEIVSN